MSDAVARLKAFEARPEVRATFRHVYKMTMKSVEEIIRDFDKIDETFRRDNQKDAQK